MISKRTKDKEDPKTRNYDIMINEDEYFKDAKENNKGGILFEIDNESWEKAKLLDSRNIKKDEDG